MSQDQKTFEPATTGAIQLGVHDEHLVADPTQRRDATQAAPDGAQLAVTVTPVGGDASGAELPHEVETPGVETGDAASPAGEVPAAPASADIRGASVCAPEAVSDLGPPSALEEPLMDTPRVLVIGVGGAGGNAVNTMIRRKLAGVEYLAANTDAQALTGSLAEARLQLGRDLTRGHGAGGKPEVGRKSAEESADAIRKALEGAHMCFIAAGMGGGTGTGAAPAIAAIARELGVLTVGVVSKPFDFEGPRRGRLAEDGVAALSETVDTIIVIPNQNLFRVASESTTFTDAFLLANEVLHQGVKGVTDLMFKPGLVNLDFADVRAVMGGMGSAMMGAGEAEGEGRAALAAEKAVDNPLLDDVTLRGARGVLINITGGPDMTLMDVEAAASRVRQDADPEADIFFGSTIEPEMQGRVRVSVVATGVQRARAEHAAPAVEQSASQPETPLETPANPAPELAQAGAEVEAQAPSLPTRGEDRTPVAPARANIGSATAERGRFDTLRRPAGPAAPEEPPVAGAGGLRSDDLVRRIAETMAPRTPEAATSETGAGETQPAKPRAAEAHDASTGGDTVVSEKPRTLGTSRPARENSKFEIPAFLRRQPG